jgi:hypothetical protein
MTPSPVSGFGLLRLVGVGIVVVSTAASRETWGQVAPDPQYQTRQSQCRHEPPPGTPLPVRRSESGVITSGYTAERVISLVADAPRLQGGDIVVCTEYGRVDILDSDDDQVRLQVRVEGFGEGAASPREAAARVIGETALHTFITDSGGRLMVRVWHSTLGFTTPGGQPAGVSVRLQVPPRGRYRVTTEAFHGNVAIRRLTLAGATMRGNVGEKLKGINGFIGQTELDNVLLAGDVDIDNLIGIPGVRDPVPPGMSSLAAPITVKARAVTSFRLSAATGGDINIAIQPGPDVGVRALGQSNEGQVGIAIDGGVAIAAAGDSTFRVQRAMSTGGFEAKATRVEIRAASGHGTVNIASIPAAPLAGRPPGR